VAAPWEGLRRPLRAGRGPGHRFPRRPPERLGAGRVPGHGEARGHAIDPAKRAPVYSLFPHARPLARRASRRPAGQRGQRLARRDWRAVSSEPRVASRDSQAVTREPPPAPRTTATRALPLERRIGSSGLPRTGFRIFPARTSSRSRSEDTGAPVEGAVQRDRGGTRAGTCPPPAGGGGTTGEAGGPRSLRGNAAGLRHLHRFPHTPRASTRHIDEVDRARTARRRCAAAASRGTNPRRIR